MTVKGIPFDSPLYEVDPEVGIEYRNCEAVMAAFTIEGNVADLLPEGLVPSSDPPLGGVWIGDYPWSTVGAYREYLSVIQVTDPGGESGFYVPYIYVTNDAAMAAGRELVGAPKKLAGIELGWEYDVVQGTLERPSGKRLVTFTLKPSGSGVSEVLRALLPSPTPMYSVRHLPPIDGKGGVTQLVKWFADVRFHTDGRGREAILTGPASLTYDSPSIIDPVHRIGVGMMIAAVHIRFDMTLGVTQILTES